MVSPELLFREQAASSVRSHELCPERQRLMRIYAELVLEQFNVTQKQNAETALREFQAHVSEHGCGGLPWH
jgi:hypothetical protein